MPAIFDFLYQEYCRARLAEMRRQLFLSSKNAEFILDLDSADRDGLIDDRTVAQHEARNH
jgi:hypothetical protein